MNLFCDVSDFHDKFGLPIAAGTQPLGNPNVRPPQVLTREEFDFRTAFLFEELREFIEGYGERDLPKMADALVDIVWVTLGTAHYLGIPFNDLWHEVRRANMTKRTWEPGDPVKPRLGMLEVTKPPGWKPPDIEGVIREFRKRFGFVEHPDDFVLEEGSFGGDLDPYSPGAQK